MKHLVAGFLGETGKAIYNTLKEYYETDGVDEKQGMIKGEYDALHITFGHKDDEVEVFKGWVRDYQKRFLKEGGLTIIHSTTAVGTSRELNAVHSPIRGMHYNMGQSIRTFVKFFGGERASEAAEIFRRIGIKVHVVDKQETTEAMKLFDTQYYLECVRFAQRVKAYCDKHNLEYSDVYRFANITYNQGYVRLEHPEYFRPVLEPIKGNVGGHCLTPNEKLLALSE